MLLEMWGLTTSQLAITPVGEAQTPKNSGALGLWFSPDSRPHWSRVCPQAKNQIRVSPRTASRSHEANLDSPGIPHSIQITQSKGCQSSDTYQRMTRTIPDGEEEQRKKTSAFGWWQ